MRESAYQSGLVSRIRERLPGCYVIRLDPTQIQGIPDLLVLFRKRWGTLEVKRDGMAPYQPNQLYHIENMGKMSFSAVIHPGNEEEVLEKLVRTLRASR